MEDEINVITTTDLYFVAYLKALGIEPIHYEIKDGHFWWDIPITPDIDQIKTLFYTGTARVEPQSLYDALRKVKMFIKEMRKGRTTR